VPQVCHGSFLRYTALVVATLTAAGLVQAQPLDFLTYRAQIGAPFSETLAPGQPLRL
jgi:hypothetical protein